jgi:hypothetical protein
VIWVQSAETRDEGMVMELSMPGAKSHPDGTKEVMVMDEVDVNVCRLSISGITSVNERMGE